MFVVDTNVLLYAANRDSEANETCRQLVEQWRARPSRWYLSWNILYEFLRVVTHPRVFPRPWSSARAWKYVEALLASPGLALLVETERHAEVAVETMGELRDLRGNVFHDVHTAVLMREHGVRRIYTRDTDFHRFDFLEVLDPLRPK